MTHSTRILRAIQSAPGGRLVDISQRSGLSRDQSSKILWSLTRAGTVRATGEPGSRQYWPATDVAGLPPWPAKGTLRRKALSHLLLTPDRYAYSTTVAVQLGWTRGQASHALSHLLGIGLLERHPQDANKARHIRMRPSAVAVRIGNRDGLIAVPNTVGLSPGGDGSLPPKEQSPKEQSPGVRPPGSTPPDTPLAPRLPLTPHQTTSPSAIEILQGRRSQLMVRIREIQREIDGLHIAISVLQEHPGACLPHRAEE